MAARVSGPGAPPRRPGAGLDAVRQHGLRGQPGARPADRHGAAPFLAWDTPIGGFGLSKTDGLVVASRSTGRTVARYQLPDGGVLGTRVIADRLFVALGDDRWFAVGASS